LKEIDYHIKEGEDSIEKIEKKKKEMETEV
jgi:hypothetical protein